MASLRERKLQTETRAHASLRSRLLRRSTMERSLARSNPSYGIPQKPQAADGNETATVEDCACPRMLHSCDAIRSNDASASICRKDSCQPRLRGRSLAGSHVTTAQGVQADVCWLQRQHQHPYRLRRGDDSESFCCTPIAAVGASSAELSAAAQTRSRA